MKRKLDKKVVYAIIMIILSSILVIHDLYYLTIGGTYTLFGFITWFCTMIIMSDAIEIVLEKTKRVLEKETR